MCTYVHVCVLYVERVTEMREPERQRKRETEEDGGLLNCFKIMF